MLSVICDPGVTPQVLARLDDLELEHQVLLLHGVRVDPPGDEVRVEVHRAQIDDVITALQAPDLRDHVDVLLHKVDELVTRPGTGAGPDDDDVAVWSATAEDLTRLGRLSSINVLLMVVGAMIAAVGIVQNQVLLIVGAMAISPDYYVVALPCLAAVWGKWPHVWRGLAAIVVSFAAAAAGGWLLIVVLNALGLTTGYVHPSQELVAFIVHPDRLSVVVALLAGVAGGLAITLPDGRGLVGVFVSVTTIPAAANIGVAIADGEWSSLGGAGAQLAVNLASIVVGVTATLYVRKHVRPRLRPFRRDSELHLP